MNERFKQLRKKLFAAIHNELEKEDSCKWYEGQIEYSEFYSDYFEDSEAEKGPEYCKIRLDCYVLGPARHYEFKGKTLDIVLDKFEEWLDENEGGFGDE